MGKKKQFNVEGIYHKLIVRVVTQKWLAKYIKDKNIMGLYEHGDAKIYIVKELAPPVKAHTFYHEVSHHILETMNGVEEEQKCDILGGYLMKLVEESERIKKHLNEEDK
jgi:hypothetical protein